MVEAGMQSRYQRRAEEAGGLRVWAKSGLMMYHNRRGGGDWVLKREMIRRQRLLMEGVRREDGNITIQKSG